ncbi:MAG: hypothetical protein ABI999_03835 [Acidobacteriota bacterium]
MSSIKLVRIILLTLVSAIVGFSQQAEDDMPVSANPQPKVAIKIDEFGKAGDCDLGARIDNLFTQLNNNPDATGYIITYSGKDFLPSDYERSPMRERIVKGMAFRKYDTSRIVFVDGGFRETVSTELFLVPPGVVAPSSSETVSKPKMPKRKTFLWGRSGIGFNDEGSDILDEFILPEVKAKQDAEFPADSVVENDGNTEASNDAPVEEVSDAPEPPFSPEDIQDLRFLWANEKFGSEIVGRKEASGILIFYADDQYYDISRVRYFVEEGKSRIANSAKLDLSRIQVIYGGYRDFPEAEFWIVPPGGEIPLAKPDERPEPASETDGQ